MQMQDVRAVVSGGASGLGEATVRHIVENGGKAAIFDLNEDRAASLVNELGHEMVFFYKTDVTDEEMVEQSFASAYEKLGKVNSVINCAGVATPGKVLSKKGVLPLGQFEKVIQINLIGTFNMLRIGANYMQSNEPNGEGERGIIINTASVAAFEGQIGQAAYSASKGGVVGMTLPIARELATHGIRVMAIAPGLVETPMFETLPEPAKQALAAMPPFPNRLGRPTEYALLVESIIRNPLLNGEVIRLDGALRMQPK
ncbi:SDR family NAD(P)-dependent oxidoreductase [Chungangia koreensis]|uniref:SDR family NAD(P)-dependent oxidoreductase n=1 Tax=Chungangia koreensis TaxID=752657 RepID=A0ABV8X678_9LACT